MLLLLLLDDEVVVVPLNKGPLCVGEPCGVLFPFEPKALALVGGADEIDG